jgi:chloramphenicol 3-O-phosphotransferase
VPREECIKFDTGAMPPDAVAREIVERFGLAG